MCPIPIFPLQYSHSRGNVDLDRDGKINKAQFCSAMDMLRKAKQTAGGGGGGGGGGGAVLLNSSLPASVSTERCRVVLVGGGGDIEVVKFSYLAPSPSLTTMTPTQIPPQKK